MARAGLGEAAPARLPARALREWHLRALALAYASPEGIEQDEIGGGRSGRIGWPTWRRLRDYRAGALVEERQVGWRPGLSASTPEYRRFLAAAGRRFYADHWGAYRRRYPDVAAPEPM